MFSETTHPLPSPGVGKIGAGVERRRWQRVNCLPASLPARAARSAAGGRSAQAGDAVEQGVLLRLKTADSPTSVLNTYACDVSLGGLAFEVKKDIALPDPLPLKVFLPHAHTPLDCSSRIAWQRLIPPPAARPKGPIRRNAADAEPSVRAGGGGMNEQTAHVGVAFPRLSEEQQETLKDFLREVGGTPAIVEREPAEVQEAGPTPPQKGSRPVCRPGDGTGRRDQAIWQFEQGVLLYHQRNLGQAKRAFQKVIKEYADIIDVVRVARRYHNEAETYGTQ